MPEREQRTMEECWRAEKNPIKLGEHILENSSLDKYIGDKIQEERTAATITEPIKGRMPTVIAIRKTTIKICDDPGLIGFPSAI